MAQNKLKIQNYKSSRLNNGMRQKLRKHVRRFLTITEAAADLRMSRQVLSRIMLKGRGSPENITKIKAALAD